MATVINEALTLSPVTGTWSLRDVEGGGGELSAASQQTNTTEENITVIKNSAPVGVLIAIH